MYVFLVKWILHCLSITSQILKQWSYYSPNWRKQTDIILQNIQDVSSELLKSNRSDFTNQEEQYLLYNLKSHWIMCSWKFMLTERSCVCISNMFVTQQDSAQYNQKGWLRNTRKILIHHFSHNFCHAIEASPEHI